MIVLRKARRRLRKRRGGLQQEEEDGDQSGKAQHGSAIIAEAGPNAKPVAWAGKIADMTLSLPHPIETARVRIRRLDPGDLEPLMAVNGDPEVTRFLPYKTWESLDDAVAWYDRMRGIEAAGAAIQMVIARRSDDVAIGTCLIFRHDETARSAELGYVLARSHWRTGIMAEAMEALVAYAFGPWESGGSTRRSSTATSARPRYCAAWVS